MGDHGKPDNDTSPAARETTSELIARLQNNTSCTDLVRIHLTRNPSTRPALVEESLLCEVSTYFAKCFDQDSPFARFKEADEEHSFTFADYTADTVKVFLYWLKHRRLPEFEDEIEAGGVMMGKGEGEWQVLLAQAWCYAEDKSVPAMQNDVMTGFITSLRAVEMTVEVLQKVMRFATRESKLRMVVLEEALFLEADGRELLEGLETKSLFGFGHDMSAAKRAFDKRNGRSGRVGEYMVKV